MYKYINKTQLKVPTKPVWEFQIHNTFIYGQATNRKFGFGDLWAIKPTKDALATKIIALPYYSLSVYMCIFTYKYICVIMCIR